MRTGMGMIGKGRWAVLLACCALALAGCDQVSGSDSSGSSKYSDNRSDSQLKDVMNAALDEAVTDDPNFANLSGITESDSSTLGGTVESEALSDVSTASANAGALQGAASPTAVQEAVAQSAVKAISQRVAQELVRQVVQDPGTRQTSIAETLVCLYGGTAEVSGVVDSSSTQSSGRASYKVTVAFHGCHVSTTTVLYGEVIYAGKIKVDSTSSGTTFDYSTTVNGGIAMSYNSGTTGYYAFILRDTIDYSGIIQSGSFGSWTFDLSLRVDDTVLNVVCTYSGSYSSSSYTASDFTCISSASTL